MLQAMMVKPGKPVLKKVEKPIPDENQVLIKIKRIGICGSDIRVFRGLHPYTTYPVVQGHEVSGEISEIGKLVKSLSVGDIVTIMPQEICGKCYPCKNNMYNDCDSLKVMGFQIGGAAQEYFAIPEEMVVKLPANLLIEEGAMIEPMSVAVHAVRRAGDVHGKKILILGAGTIGNFVGQASKGLGADKVMITDLNDFRLDLSKKCGIDIIVNPQKEDLKEAVLSGFGPDKSDIIIDCVGIENTISQAISLARKGSTIIVVGVFSEKPTIDLGLVQDYELNLIGSNMFMKKDYLKAIELAESGKLAMEELITDRFSLSSYEKVYKYIEENKDHIMKVMLEID